MERGKADVPTMGDDDAVHIEEIENTAKSAKTIMKKEVEEKTKTGSVVADLKTKSSQTETAAETKGTNEIGKEKGKKNSKERFDDALVQINGDFKSDEAKFTNRESIASSDKKSEGEEDTSMKSKIDVKSPSEDLVNDKRDEGKVVETKKSKEGGVQEDGEEEEEEVETIPVPEPVRQCYYKFKTAWEACQEEINSSENYEELVCQIAAGGDHLLPNCWRAVIEKMKECNHPESLNMVIDKNQKRAAKACKELREKQITTPRKDKLCAATSD